MGMLYASEQSFTSGRGVPGLPRSLIGLIPNRTRSHVADCRRAPEQNYSIPSAKFDEFKPTNAHEVMLLITLDNYINLIKEPNGTSWA